MGMSQIDIQIIRAADVRRSLTKPGDIRGEIGFQNDINALLARFDEVRVPWQALSGPTPTLPVSVLADPPPPPAAPPPGAARPHAVRITRMDVGLPRLRVLEGGAAPTLGLLTVTVPEPTATAPAKQPRPATASGGARTPRRR